MADTMKLTYFNGRGRAELTRLLLAKAGVKYEDVRLESQQWSELKPKTPKGSLPILEHKGNTYCESMAIAKYVARETKLYGCNNYEAAVCDMMCDSVADIFKASSAVGKKEQSGQEKSEALKKLEEAVTMFDKFVLSLKKGKFILGQQLSLADVAVFLASEIIVSANKDIDWSHYPTFNAIVTNVRSDKAISDWLNTRPVTLF